MPAGHKHIGFSARQVGRRPLLARTLLFSSVSRGVKEIDERRKSPHQRFTFTLAIADRVFALIDLPFPAPLWPEALLARASGLFLRAVAVARRRSVLGPIAGNTKAAAERNHVRQRPWFLLDAESSVLS
jgi:hypothetical protein